MQHGFDKFNCTAAVPGVSGKRFFRRVFFCSGFQDITTGLGIMQISGMDDHLNEITQRIHYDMPLASFGFLTSVKPAFITCSAGLHALRVDKAIDRGWAFAVFFAGIDSVDPTQSPKRLDDSTGYSGHKPFSRAETPSAAGACAPVLFK